MRLSQLIENHVRSKKSGYEASDISMHDKVWNPEADYYASQERARTKRLWDEADGGVPVVETDTSEGGREKYTSTPKKGEEQSAGYRGEQQARQRAGAPYRPWQKHDPTFMKRADFDF